MSAIKLPVDQCPLCGLKDVHSVVCMGADRARLYYCFNCGTYSIGYFAYRSTSIISNSSVRVKLSYFIRHNTSEENPIFIEKANYETIINSVTLPPVTVQLENLLLWFGDNSNNAFNTVDGYTSHLPALIGCNNANEIIYLLDELLEKKFIVMERPTTPPLREREFFDAFCGHLTLEGVQKVEEIQRTNSPLNFNITDNSVESILKQNESSIIEVKGSSKLNLDRLLKIDNKKNLEDKIALEGFLKVTVAF